MKQITKYPIRDQNLKKSLVYIGDLVYTDEPILSLFRDERNDELYLFDWVDADARTNRWLVYKIELQILSKFIQKEISFKEMINTVGNYLVADIEGGALPPFDINQLKDLPQGYYPDTDLIFDEEYTRDLDDIKSVLNNIIEKPKNENRLHAFPKNVIVFPKKYQSSEQHYYVRIEASTFPSLNNIRDEIHSSTLSHQNEIKPNRVLHKI